MSGPLVALGSLLLSAGSLVGSLVLLLAGCGGCAAELLLLLLAASCFATSRSASANPSSPSGLVGLSPAVGSAVAFCTGTAGYLPRCLVVDTLAFMS